MQLLFQYCKRVVLLAQLVIMFSHFFDEFTILQNFPYMINRLVCDEAVEFYSLESFWFNIYRIDRIVIDKDRSAMINGFQKSVAKSFEQRWECNQICKWINVA